MADAGSSDSAEDRIFLTYDSFADEVEALLSEVRRLEKEPAGASELPPELDARVRALISKGARTGMILDSFKERRDFQKELDYLVKLLERFHAKHEDATLAPFQPESLASIPVPPFPFDDIREQQEGFPKPTSEVIQEYLLSKARAAKLRFDDGLVEELSAQMAGDPEAWPLLWFCLKHLYAALSERRLGNKLRRPDNKPSFDCRSFLVDIAERAYDDFPDSHKPRLKALLVEFGLRAGAKGEQTPTISARKLASLSSGWPVNLVDHLNRYYLLWPIQSDPGDQTYRLVHRSVLERWDALREWVQTSRALRRQWKIGAVAVLVLCLLGALLYAYLANERKEEAESGELAMRSLDLLSLNNDLALAAALEAVCKRKTDLAWESLARALDDRKETRRFNPPINDRESVEVGYAAGRAYVLTRDLEGQVKVWDASSGKLLGELREKHLNPLMVSFSSDKPRAAVARQDAQKRWHVQIWDLSSREPVGADIQLDAQPIALALSNDGGRLAIGAEKRAVRIYSDSGTQVSYVPPARDERPLKGLAFGPDAVRLVGYEDSVGDQPSRATVWKVATGDRLTTLRGGKNEQIMAVGFMPSADRVVTVGQEYLVGVHVRTWGQDGTGNDNILAETSPLTHAAVNADGTQVLLVGLDGTITVWDRAQKQKKLVVRPSASSWGATGSFRPDGEEIVLTNSDSTVRLWSMSMTALSYVDGNLNSADFSPDGKHVAAGTVHGLIKVWDLPRTRAPIQMSSNASQGPEGRVQSNLVNQLRYSRDGTRLAAAYSDGWARVWDPRDGSLIKAVRAADEIKGTPTPDEVKAIRAPYKPGEATCANTSPDNQRLVTTSSNGDVALWQIDRGELVKRIKPARSSAQAICATFTDDGEHVVVVARNGQSRLWAWRTQQTIDLRRSERDEATRFDLTDASISSTGDRFAATSAIRGANAVVFQTSTGKLLGQLPAVKRITNFTADGMRIGTVDLDGGISAWDAVRLRRVARLGADQTLAALSGDGHSVFQAQGPAWFVHHCRACGQIPDGPLKEKLIQEAEDVLEGVVESKRFHEQFSCVGKHTGE